MNNQSGNLKLKSIAIISCLVICCYGNVMATYSIVAVDTITGAIGGAGASCIAGSHIINDIIEDVGAVHTQAYYLPQNQNNAHDLLATGATPDEIITWLEYNDVEGTSDYRQYGVVTLAGQGSSAAFTGFSTSYWKGHITGPGYSIQGNILLGTEILDNMEQAYLNTPGPLEDRLMAALEAANVPGADTRCMPCNKPSISAFIKVIHSGDGNTPYLYELVTNTICAINPMDGLWIKYNEWKALKYADADLSGIVADPVFLPASGIAVSTITISPLNFEGDPPIAGSEVALANSGDGLLSAVADNGDGTFSALLTAPSIPGADTVTATVTAGGQVVELTQKAVVDYYLCGDPNADLSTNLADAGYIINYIFYDGPTPQPLGSGDANADGGVNLGDTGYIINYIFYDGPGPACP